METVVVVNDSSSSEGSEAVRFWFAEHAADLHGYASRRVGQDLADDVVAETFRCAIESFDRHDPSRGTPRGWLFGIATNLLRRHWRTEMRKRSALERSLRRDPLPADLTDSVDARLDAEQAIARVLAAARGLRREDYEVLVLSVWERLSHQEIGEALDIPAGTVGSRLHRIRRQLEGQL